MNTIEFPIEEVRKKQVKEKFRAAFDKVPQELWQELADDIEKEFSELRKELKKYRPMFAEWKRNKDKEQKKNNVFSEVVR